MPILVAGGIAQLSASTRAVLNGGQQACPRIAPTCNRRVSSPSWAAIFNNANTTVGDQVSGVHRITKTGGVASTWDSDAISAMSFAGDFVLMAQPLQTNADLIVGVNADPLTDSDWAGIDRGMLFSSDGNIYFVGSGFLSGALAVYQTNRFYFIRRSGTVVDLLWNTTNDVTTATSLSDFGGLHTYTADTYFDSSLYTSGGAVDVRLDVPPPSTIDLIAGSSSITFAPTGTLTGKGALTGSSSITFTPTGSIIGKGAVTGTTTLTFTPAGTLTGKGALAGTATLVLSPAGTITGKGAITATTALTFAPAATLSGAGALSGSSSIVFAPTGTITGRGQIAGSAALTFMLSGSMGEPPLLWTVQPPSEASFVNDNLPNATWAEANIAQSSFTNNPANTGTWIEEELVNASWH